MAFWQAGFWQAGFWKDGFWEGMSARGRTRGGAYNPGEGVRKKKKPLQLRLRNAEIVNRIKVE